MKCIVYISGRGVPQNFGKLLKCAVSEKRLRCTSLVNQT